MAYLHDLIDSPVVLLSYPFIPFIHPTIYFWLIFVLYLFQSWMGTFEVLMVLLH